MSIEKQAAHAVNMLMNEGVDFDTATDLVMEKVAGTGASIYFRGAAATERKVAKEHGQEGPEKSFWGDYKQNNSAMQRAGGRGLLTGAVAGTATYHGAKALANRAIRRGATTLHRGLTFTAGMTAIGAGAGYVGGIATSLKNQGKEMHKKYQEKSAAVNMLMDQGVDFETAAELVSAKSTELFGN